MSEIPTRQRTRVHHWPVKAWLFAAALFVFGLKLLTSHEDE
jgi:hypothetical protein